MRVLLDHNMPVQITSLLPGHEVSSAREMHWNFSKMENFSSCRRSGFHVMLTGDKSIYYQQNNQLRKVSLVVLSTNDWAAIAVSGSLIEEAIARTAMGSLELIQILAERKRSRQ